MALFRRKTNDSVLPEVDEYYQAERRDRGWLAWLLAIASVLVVVLLIAGLFLGGRWAYNKITEDDGEDVAVTDNNGTVDEGLSVDGDPTNSDQNQGSTDQPSTDQPATDQNNTNNQGSTDQNNTGNNGSAGQAQTPPANDNSNTPAPASPAPATPTTGDDSGNLPNTGPADIAGIFVSVSAVAGGAHYLHQRRKATR